MWDDPLMGNQAFSEASHFPATGHVRLTLIKLNKINPPSPTNSHSEKRRRNPLEIIYLCVSIRRRRRRPRRHGGVYPKTPFRHRQPIESTLFLACRIHIHMGDDRFQSAHLVQICIMKPITARPGSVQVVKNGPLP